MLISAVLGLGLMGAAPLGAQTYTIRGTIFEDVNYGGGPGRARSSATGWQAAANGSSRATVELYDTGGAFLATTQAGADGTYSFAGRPAGAYRVRLVLQTTPSARTGWANTLRPVLVYRTDGSTGEVTASGVLDRVGGENPALGDTTANTGTQTLAQLTSATAQPQAVAPVTLTANDVSDVDFGVHFTTVTSTRNAGAGSLRQALTNANALGNDAALAQAGREAGREHVVFMISNGTTGGGGSLSLAAGGLRSANNYFTGTVATITPGTGASLPELSTGMVLDAQAQPGWTSAPVIELAGTNLANTRALSLTGGSSIVRGLTINRFSGGSGWAVFITGGSNHVIAGNWIGVTAAGNAASANGTGVGLTNTSDVRVGGTLPADRNVLSGNGNDGLNIDNAASGTLVRGNYIGVAADGTTRVANGRFGVRISGATNTEIGGIAVGARNIVSGNGNVNVYHEATGTGTVIRGNFIGLAATGAAVVNGSHGIMTLAPNVVIGGTTAGERNVIGSNTNDGVVLQSSGNTVQGNYVGVDPTGTVARANTRYGVYLFTAAASGNLIGGNVSGAGNLISGNTNNNGIRVEGPDNVIRGNVIGLTSTNATGVPNNAGVVIVNAANTIIGDTVALGRNVISGNINQGVLITGAAATDTRIWGNYIGTDTTGTAARANTGTGVYVITAASGTIVGGRSPGMRNILAGNTQQGVRLDAPGNTVRGNFIGLNVLNASLPNANAGVFVSSAANNVIGDTVASGRNVISGNGNQGIQLAGAATTNTLIWGNYIGTDSSGTLARPNTSIGVLIQSSASANSIGGNGPGMRNIIAGNTQQGVQLASPGNIVRGNVIGLNVLNASLPNTNVGVWVNNAANNIIGDSVASGRNIISGNTNQGIQVFGASATNTRIWGNYIGTDTTGTVARANTNVGVWVVSSATGTLIGGNTPGMRNIISGNGQQGIQLAAPGNIVRGNVIGLNVLNASLPNTNVGLYILNGANNVVGDTVASGRNVISGNTSDGVQIAGAAATGNVVRGNYIGVDSTGTVARANTRFGVYTVTSATSNTIGGRVPGARNIIAGNTSTGVQLETAGNTVLGNFIGLNAANQTVANGSSGVIVNNVANTIVGDTTALGRNVISGNTFDGVQVTGSAATNTRIWGNLIGLDSSGTVTRPNGRIGVLVFNGATGASLGGTHPLAFNRIANNAGLGIDISATNSFDGVSANDGLKPAGTTNLGMDAPVLTSATSSGATVTVTGYVGSTPGQTLFGGARVDVVVSDNDASGYGEGSVFLGALTADGSGNFSGTLPVPVGVTLTDGVTRLSAIATDASGNSSEFARNVTLGLTSGSGAIAGTIFDDLNYGGGAGRSRATATGWQPANNGVSRATVELYDATGALRSSTFTNPDGTYGFYSLPSGSYKVRLVTYTAPSSRTGWVNTLRPVLTYRTDASSGTVVDVTDRVGGDNPLLPDTLANTGTQTLAQLTTADAQPQAVSDVLVAGGTVSGIDFGVNFSTVTRTANLGQGTLRQFVTNVNALQGQAGLTQAGQRSRLGNAEALPSGIETSIFMIPGGEARPGLRASTPGQLTNGVAQIALATVLPTLSRALVSVDATTQTVNGGNTNPVLLGTGGVVGVDNLTVPQVQGPEVLLTGARNRDGLLVSAANVQVRGLAMRTFSRAITVGTAVSVLIEENALGPDATATADPGNSRSIAGIQLNGAATGATIRHNLIAFHANSAILVNAAATGVTITANEIRSSGMESNVSDNIAFATGTQASSNWLISGNRIHDGRAVGIEIGGFGALPMTITNNTISGNGLSNTETVGLFVSGAGTYLVSKNVITGNRGSGISVGNTTVGAQLSQNVVWGNNVANTGVSGGISHGTATSVQRRGTTPTPNDGLKPAGSANLGMDHPVFTTVAALPSGRLQVQGYVGSAPGQTLFGGAIVEVFTSDNNALGTGDGTALLGTVTAAADGSFSDSLSVPAGVTVTPGTTRLTATARDSAGNTSEFGAQASVSGGAATLAISGTIFEDVNYGGGAGRSRSAATGWTPASNGSSRATVELYTGSGAYLTRITAGADGTYTFGTLAPGNYQVRLVISSTPSSRPGWTSALAPVLTYRSDASSGTAVDVTDRVGGESPNLLDAAANAGAQTLDALTTGSAVAQAVTPVTLSTAAINEVDFGVHFTTVTSTRNSGAGSLRQVLMNADALGNDATLAAAGRGTGVEHVIFMLGNGTTGSGGSLNLTGGLRTGVNLFTTPGVTSTVASIATGGAALTLTTPVVIDAQTQPGWTLHPIVELPSMPLTLRGGNSVVRGLIFNNGARIAVDSIGAATIQGNWFGLDAVGTGTAFATKAINHIWVLAGDAVRIGGTTPAARNVFADGSFNAVELNAGSGHVIQGNYFGTTFTGTAPRPQAGRNVLLNGLVTGTLIGGSAPGEGNVLGAIHTASVNTRGAISLLAAPSGAPVGTIIRGNRLGIGADGVSSLGGAGVGIWAVGTGTILGGSLPSEANVITGFAAGGVHVAPTDVSVTPAAVATVRVSGNSIYGNGGLAVDLQADGVTTNDGVLTPGAANTLLDTPVITSATILPSGALQVSGYVGSAAGQTAFGGSVVELFASATGAGLPGSGRTFLGRITAAADGTFSDSIAVPVSVRSGTTPITATATTADGSTSEFSNSVAVTGTAVGPLAISGTVFDDVNYGGGPGRSRSEATGALPTRSATDAARLELYDATGNFLAATSVDATGQYTFGALTAGRYQVRLVTTRTPTARAGYVGGVLPVLTFRTDAASGTVLPLRDRVGGEQPMLSDAGENNGAQTLSTLTAEGMTPQAVTTVALTTTPITGIDFGVNFTVVTNTNDNGGGSLRQVITNANALSDDASLAQGGRIAGVEHVVFMLSNGSTGGGGKLNLADGGLRADINLFTTSAGSRSVATIQPRTLLPAITGTLVVDAQAQPGWVSSTAAPVVELRGDLVSGTALSFTGGRSVLRGFIANRFPGSSNVISMAGTGRHVVEGNWIGTDATGSAAAANAFVGLTILSGADSTRIGGPAVQQRNVFGANNASALTLAATGVVIQGNYFGLGADGITRLNSAQNWFDIEAFAGNLRVGGPLPGEGNVFGGNPVKGAIFLGGGSNDTIQGNIIGLAADRTTRVPNAGNGVWIPQGSGHLVGGVNPGEGNVITASGTIGVHICCSATRVALLGNSIYGNGTTGLDIFGNGVTVNDGVYTPGQPNRLIDHPVITSASLLPSGKLLVSGFVGTAPGQTVFTDDRVELFVSDNDGLGFGEGRTFIGAVRTGLTTSDFSDSLTIPIGVTLRPGTTFLTGTTTDADGNTSEFGANFRYGTGTLAISGTVFEDLNYGGGAGRPRNAATGWQPASNGTSRARLELYDDAGTFISTTNAAADGAYSFGGLSAGSYQVRLATLTAPSSRTGWTTAAAPVITYRTNASSGAPVGVTDSIGGTNPHLPDAGNNTTAQSLPALTTSTAVPKAVTAVTLAGTSITDVDFGVNFSTIVNTQNTGQGSLRQFITNANLLGGVTTLAQAGRTPGSETSIFMLPTSSPGYQATTQTWRIAVSSTLPLTATRTIIDGTTQAGTTLGDLRAGVPHTLRVLVAGSNTTIPLLSLSGNDSGIRGLAIGTALNGVVFTTGQRNFLRSSYVGTDITGTAAAATAVGVAVTSASETTIGGSGVADGNLIAGTGTTGILVNAATALSVRGNLIGTDVSGLHLLGTRERGFNDGTGTTTVREFRDNVIVGSSVGAFVIDNDAILTPVTGQSTWALAGNFIGVGRDGSTPLPNAAGIITAPGATTFNATGMIIGGTTAGDRNVIAANTGAGIDIRNPATGLVIRGNHIGVAADGVTARGNGGSGIALATTTPITIGGNVIANNAAAGIALAAGSAPVTITGNDTYFNAGTGIDLGADGPTANDGATNGAQPNAGMDSPVITSLVLSPSGRLIVSGHVGSAPGQTVFGNSRVELFLADDETSGFGEGRRYLSFATADASGAFTDSVSAPTGMSFRGGVTTITATATDGAGNTSEFGTRVMLAGGPLAISGTVFEDRNYGGGAGRPRANATGWAPASTATARATIELYDGAGDFITSVRTNADGTYSIGGLTAGTYQVRLLTQTAPSSRANGIVADVQPVLTYRTAGAGGSLTDVVDHVGGTDPARDDAAPNTGTQRLSDLATATTMPQAVTSVTLDAASLTGVDFGVNFSTIVSTKNAGQGSLRQFLLNANALGGQSTLAQAGSRSRLGSTEPLPAGVETSIFMIPGGAAVPGIRSSLASQLTNGVARIAVSPALPTVSRALVAVDGTTQTVNVGNTNTAMLGSGGTVGVDAVPLAQVPGPEVQLTGTRSFDALTLTAANVQVRGMAMRAFSGVIVLGSAPNAVIEENVIGTDATAVADPGTNRHNNAIWIIGAAHAMTLRHNLIAFSGGNGFVVSAAANDGTITANEFRASGLENDVSDGIGFSTAGAFASVNWLIRGNRIADGRAIGIDIPAFGALPVTITNNTITNNGQSGNETVGVYVGGTGRILLSKNVITGSHGSGISVGPSAVGLQLSQNVVWGNNTGASAGRSAGISHATSGLPLRRGTTPTLNDGFKSAGRANQGMDHPVFTSTSLDGSSLTVTGFVGSAPNQSTFAGSTVEVFVSDGNASGLGDGITYLGTVTSGANGNFTGTFTVPAGVTLVPAQTPLTGTATDVIGNTSEFGRTTLLGPWADVVTTIAGPVTGTAGVAQPYTLKAKNTGPYAASAVQLVLPVPSGVSVTAISDGGTITSGSIVWPAVSSVAVGDSVLRTFSASANADGVYTYAARSVAATADADSTNNNGSRTTARVATVLGAGADVILASRTVPSVSVGVPATLVRSMRNAGAVATVADLELVDSLPAGVTFAAATGTGWSCGTAGALVTCRRAPLAAGDSTSLALQTTIDTAAVPRAIVVSSLFAPGDVDTLSNRLRDTLRVASGIDVLVRATAEPLSIGEDRTLRLVAANVGTAATVAPITLGDSLPDGVAFRSGSGTDWTCTATGRAFSCARATALAARDSSVLTLTVAAQPEAAATLPAAFRVRTSGDTDSANDTTTVTLSVSARSDVATTLTGPTEKLAGVLSSRFTVTVRNRGPAPSAAVAATVTLPAGITADSVSHGGTVTGSAITWPAITTLASNDSAQRTFMARTSTPGAYRFTAASIASTPDDSLANHDGSQPAAQVTTTVTSGVDLALTAAASGEFIVGRDGLVHVTITNRGVGPTIGPLTLTDTLPAGLTFKSVANTRFTCSATGNVLGCTSSDTLAARDSVTLPITFNVLPAAMPGVALRNRVATTGDFNPVNDTTTVQLTVRGDFLIFAEVNATRTEAELGDPVDFTGSAKVVGQSPVPGVTYRIRLPRGFAYQPGTLVIDGTRVNARTQRTTPDAPTATLGGALLGDDPIPAADGTLDVPLGDLAAGSTVALRWRVRLGPGAQRSDGRVSVQAVSNVVSSTSNTARAQVRVRGGVFTDRGIIFGKVFVDCACDSTGRATQDRREVGVPGVRLVMEDGTSVITDAEGKYSLPGLRPTLHVLRVDVTSLPAGAQLVLTGNRNAGNPGSRFVDLTNGELQKADFAIARRDGVVDAVRARRVASLTARPVEPTPDGFGIRTTAATVAQGGAVRGAPLGPITNDTGAVVMATAPADSTAGAGAGTAATGGAATTAPGMLTWSPRRFIAAGLLHGRLELRQFTRGMPRVDDGFDDALRSLARQNGDSTQRAGVRAAFYASGDIAKRTRLTLAYDSERDRTLDLFRDIDPEESYGVFGDASIREFDARSAGGIGRSAGRGFARIDHKRNTLLIGDFTAPPSDEARRLSAYDRTMTGVRQHVEVGDADRSATVDGFVSRTTLAQRVEELPGVGVSGPYQLSRTDVRMNSEQVELVVRDRNQPALVLSRTPLGRFTDYTLERDAGRLLFRAPVPSVDANLNPVSVRVSYEVEQGGEAYLAYGADARVRAGRAMLGAAAVRDENPLAARDVMGVHGSLRLGRTTLLAEVARTDGAPVSATNGATLDTVAQRRVGDAGRIELRHQGSRLNLQLSGALTSQHFANPSALQPAGRAEVGGNGSITLTPHTRLLLQMLRTEDRLTGGRRDGALVSLEQQFWSRVRLELGYRWAEENRNPMRADSTLAAPLLQPSSLAALRSRLTVDLLRGTRFRSSVAGEFEQDMRIREQQRAAVSGDLGFARGARLYARHEFLRSAGGPFALGASQTQASTVVGLTADVRTNQQLFNEYRMRDGMSGRQAEAAFGLRNRWRVDSGLVLNTSLERVTPVGGDSAVSRSSGTARSLAVTSGVEFTRWEGLRATARAEFRQTAQGNSWLGSAGVAQQITRGLTFLGRGLYSSAPRQDRFRGQLGLALRPVDTDVWNALLRVDERRESSRVADTTVSNATVVSLHLNVQPRGRLALSSRYALKRGLEQRTSATFDERTRSLTQLIAARALYDLTPTWDVALQGSLLGSAAFTQRSTGLGLSVGRRVLRDLRVAAGYNLFGWTDADLAGAASTTRGFMVEFGYKFDDMTLRRR